MSASTSDSDTRERIEDAYRRRTPGSRTLHEEAVRSMPGGDTRTTTFFHPYPLYMERGEGCQLFDVDGNAYLDFQANYTSLVHGHARPEIVQAVTEQAERGTVHGAPTVSLTRWAAHLVDRIESIERIRFTNSGTEAVMMAIRLARAHTGRGGILKMEGSYHGSYDEGCEATQLVAPFNDPVAATRLVRANRHELAAVLVEPMLGRAGALPAEPAFLEALRTATEDVGALLIFDEIQSFRLAWGGAQALYDVEPDLTTLGKVIGGGLPAGAFGGRAELMDVFDPRVPGHVPHAGTFNGTPLVATAGLAALNLLTAEAIQRINELGSRLRRGLQEALDQAGVRATVTGPGSYAHIHFRGPPVRNHQDAVIGRQDVGPIFHLALLNHGVFSARGQRFVISTAMTKREVEQAITALAHALEDLQTFLATEGTAASCP